MADPVAAKSSFLCMYMSNHPDTLVSYVRHWGKVSEKVKSAQMLAIDTKGMTLRYTTEAGKGSDAQKEIRVPFDPPLAGYEDVKPRLLEMKVDAEKALGMAKNPQITTFELGPDAWKSGLAAAVLAYVTIAPTPDSPAYGPLFAPANALRNALPGSALVWAWVVLLTLHSAEALYTYSLCRRHKTGYYNTILYLLATVMFGFPVWTNFRRRVQAARIESIMKGE